MNIYLKLLNFFIDLILPLIVGYCIGQYTTITQRKLDKAISINLFFIFPLIGLLSSWTLRLSHDILLLPILGVASLLISGVVALGVGRLKKMNPIDQGSYFLSTMLSNRGTIGGISVFILFGEAGYAYGTISLMLNSFIIYGVCYPIASYFRDQHTGEKTNASFLSYIFNKRMMPLLGLFIGLALNISNIHQPDIFSKMLPNFVHISAWLALVPIGALIEFKEMRHYLIKVLDILPIKFIILPLLNLLLIISVIQDPLFIKVLTVLSATPTAINAVIATRINRLNVHLSTAAFVTTTLTYLLIVYPILLIFL